MAMEVTILAVENPPDEPILALHAGSVRRQARLEVNQSFVMPYPGSGPSTVEVSLFQQLASHVLPADGEAEVFCDIPLSKDGSAAQVKLRVRRGEAALKPETPKGTPRDAAVMTKDYLEYHQLQQRVQSLIQDVLREQPEDPYRYMLAQLRKCHADRSDKAPLSTTTPSTTATPSMSSAAPSNANSLAQVTPPSDPCPKKRGRSSLTKTATGAESAAPREAAGSDEAAPRVRTRPEGVMDQARASVMLVLRGDACLKAAEESQRKAARKTIATNLSRDIIASMRSKLAKEETMSHDQRGVARGVVRSSIKQSAVLLSEPYHRNMTRWARGLAYRGALRLLSFSLDDEDAEGAQNCLDVEAFNKRRASLMQPIVYLEHGSSWSSWLCGPSPTSRPPSATSRSLSGAASPHKGG